jgi:hypothetical protein
LVTVLIGFDVEMPLVPAILQLDTLARVPVDATATQQVSRLWSSQ